MTLAYKYLILLLSIFLPIYPIMIVVMGAVIIDTLYGRWCAKKLAIRYNKDVRLEVTSKKTRMGFVAKTLAYQSIMILTFILDKYFLDDLLSYFFPSLNVEFLISKLTGVVFILIELDSIDEKYYKVNKKRLSDIIKEKINFIKKLIIGTKNFNDNIKKDK